MLVAAVGPDRVRVVAARNSACAQCASRSNCSQGLLSQWSSGKTVEIDVLNPAALPVTPGQRVVVGLEEGSLVRASVLLYLLPLALLIAGALLGSALGLAEGWQVALATLLMGAGFLLARWQGRRDGAESRYRPVLLRTIQAEGDS